MTFHQEASRPIKYGSVDEAILSAIIDDVDADAEAIERYLKSEYGMVTAGDPPLLTRTQKSAKKGLPNWKDLLALARTWLEAARMLWPEMAASGHLPQISDVTIEDLARDYIRRFVQGKVVEYHWPLDKGSIQGLAIIYVRYSDDNSNPRSLDDQLDQAMAKAKSESRFVPWVYVFADSSISGRTHLRRGYRLAKEAIEKFADTQFDTLYFDEFSRATRAAIETYRLATLLERFGKRMIGVSDGFVLGTESAKILIMASAMFNEWFLDQLRKKVLRGMKGAAKRGTSLGRVRFGFQLVPVLDSRGNPRINAKDKPIKRPAVDDEAMKYVIQAAEWFGYHNKAYKWIARRFNTMRVGDRDNWTGGEIAKMLACPLFIGILIFNRTRTVWDTETGEFTVKPNPRKEWVITEIEELKAWPDELWKAVRRRAAVVRDKAPRTGTKNMPKVAQNELYPTTMVDGVLFCGDCGKEIRLVRSDGDYRQLGCLNGSNKVNSCSMSSSKSLRYVEEALLRYIREKILTTAHIAKVLTDANAYLEEEAKKPRVDTGPVENTIFEMERKEKELVAFVMANQAHHDMSSYLAKGDQLAKEIKMLKEELSQMKARHAEPPAPLRIEDVERYVNDMRSLFKPTVEKTAVLMRALLGKVMVHQIKESGRSRWVWIGNVRGDLVPFMARSAKEVDYPDWKTWECQFIRTDCLRSAAGASQRACTR